MSRLNTTFVQEFTSTFKNMKENIKKKLFQGNSKGDSQQKVLGSNILSDLESNTQKKK